MAAAPSTLSQARGIFDKLRYGLAEMPAKACFKNFDYQVAEGNLAIEMKTPTDFRADLTLKLTTSKKRLNQVWFHFNQGQFLDAKQDRTRTLKVTQTPDFLGFTLAAPMTPQYPASVLIRYRFNPGELGEIPLPVAPSTRYPLTVNGKCGQGYEMIFPGILEDMTLDRGMRNYVWQAPRAFKLHLIALHDPKRYLVQAADHNFYYYYHPVSEPNAKAVTELLAEIYTAQIKINGPLAYRDYYLVEVSPKVCPTSVGMGGIILLPNGIFKIYDKARATGIIENELLREWKGRKGENLKEVR
jgi:hypothetical protein